MLKVVGHQNPFFGQVGSAFRAAEVGPGTPENKGTMPQ